MDQNKFSYQMDLDSRIHPNAICVGAGPGAGVSCSNYGALRRKVSQIGDPTLVQRSWLSSGAPPGPLNTAPDTLNQPLRTVNPTGVHLNRGLGMEPKYNHVLRSETGSWNERDISQRFLFPSQWPGGYSGMRGGGFMPTRMMAARDASTKYERKEGVKRVSYGSYGN